jgi:membrane-associated phospholipid phosphatase
MGWSAGTGPAMRSHVERFPLTWADARRFFVYYVVLSAVGIGVGLLLTHPLRHSWVQHLDQSIEERLAAHRTSTMNSLTFIGSELADTVVKIAVTVVVSVAMLLAWKRWREPLMVACALVLEAASFITITWTVGRPRPDVDRLETSPVGSSFPSGHTAAAMAYGAIVVVIFWHTRKRWIRWVAVLVVAFVVAAAGYSRMYRGMHHLTDVLAGIVLGAASVILTYRIIAPHQVPVAPERELEPVP